MSSRSNNTFILFLHPQGCAQSLRKWLHNNLISIMAICLGAGLLEVIWPRPHHRLVYLDGFPLPRKRACFAVASLSLAALAWAGAENWLLQTLRHMRALPATLSRR